MFFSLGLRVAVSGFWFTPDCSTVRPSNKALVVGSWVKLKTTGPADFSRVSVETCLVVLIWTRTSYFVTNVYRKSLYLVCIISMYTRHELLSHAQPLCWTAGSHELLLVYLRIYHIFFGEVPSWDLGQWINISLTKGNAMPPGSGVCHFVFWVWNYVALMQAIFARPFNKRSVPAPSAGCQAWDCGEPECSKSCKAARGLSVFSCFFTSQGKTLPGPQASVADTAL